VQEFLKEPLMHSPLRPDHRTAQDARPLKRRSGLSPVIDVRGINERITLFVTVNHNGVTYKEEANQHIRATLNKLISNG
jgi:hypothetical protein